MSTTDTQRTTRAEAENLYPLDHHSLVQYEHLPPQIKIVHDYLALLDEVELYQTIYGAIGEDTEQEKAMS